jgi:hypothetical protein
MTMVMVGMVLGLGLGLGLGALSHPDDGCAAYSNLVDARASI